MKRALLQVCGAGSAGLSIVLAAALSTSAVAQTRTVSPRQDFAGIEGSGMADIFGAHASMRAQLADSSVRRGVILMRSLSFRPDYTNHARESGMGRSWRQVRLNMSEFDAAKMSSDPGANMPSTRTEVFNGPTTWPTLVGNPASKPAAWSVSFPFRSTWVYTGQQDLLADFEFAGGTLANNGRWPPGRIEYYLLDAHHAGESASGTLATFGDFGTLGGCGDSSNTVPFNREGASTTLRFTHYGPTYRIPSFRQQGEAKLEVRFVGQNTNILTAVGLARLASGVNLPGVACNQLWVDTSLPTIFLGSRSSAAGAGYGVVTRTLFGPSVVPTAALNVELYAQSAWTDTGTGALRLSSAGASAMPRMPLWNSPALVPRVAVYEFPRSRTSMTRQGPDRAENLNPITAYGW